MPNLFFYVPPGRDVKFCTEEHPYDRGIQAVWRHPDAIEIESKNGIRLFECPYCGLKVEKQETEKEPSITTSSLVAPFEEREYDMVSRRRLGYAGVASISLVFLLHNLEVEKPDWEIYAAILCFVIAIPLLVSSVLIIEGQLNHKYHTVNGDHWVAFQSLPGAILGFAGIILTIASSSWWFAVTFLLASFFAYFMMLSPAHEEMGLDEEGVTYESLIEKHANYRDNKSNH